MVKEFFYRGRKLEELMKMDTREFASLLNSRARRSVLRNFSKIEKFLERCRKKIGKGKEIRTHERDLIIVPKMVGMNIKVHNGKEFVPISIITEMLGHYLGEFALTRRKVEHGAPGIGATKSSSALSVK